uniref:Peptide cyclase 1 n=1 Tax=Gypsophila vaccaria TaxID=39387 RepID=UPI000B34A7CF|nr:Chain A, Peptide cyclase 1 [Gypsophila vaccaria]5UW3_B Chain B, Peptide cyclase 1 [Gypsophila vaccaria]5UW3_C Chain C, Peptide cyclase 1 [Gypsophila vaccaria]5UW3_D Chain D, Peptide cyclase 1 [Gypsophila vaccaria]5UW6_A Chain A, Peptide cyclase 1 [Gypsophila vaccaria]5UW6_B Chain B, Peptide cyclase 1 [Gypsophila vaccaria]5UW6_C Chain C, Peptide cyclase 1 [Gypsophila vaccaria]5UW6_D Chain D, Peptide cyclase 1 [Gypsophila vaccaria]
MSYYHHHHHHLESTSLYKKAGSEFALMATSGFSKPLHYPPVRRDETVVDDYFGVKVADPYRWLEDPNSEETKEFVDNQEKLANSVLEECELIDKFKQKIIDFVNFPRCGVPFRRANKYFHFYNSGLQAQNVFQMQDDLDGKPEVLYDPNLREGGRSGLSLYSVSEDAKYFAFGIHSGLTEWVTIKILKTEDRSYLPDTLEWVKFSPAIWTHDNKGFFYCPYPPLKEGEDHMTRSAVNQEARYHFLGTDQSEDILLWRDLENPAHHLKCQITDDGKYFLLYILDGCDDANKVYCLDLTKLPNGLESFRGREDSAPFMKLIDSFDASYTAIANDGSVFTFQTNKDAPRKKLVRVDLNNPSVWTDLVPESKKDLLESAHAVNENQLILRYLSDVKHVLEIRDLESGALQHRLPIDIGSVDGITARRRDSVVFFKFTSILTPGIVYQCDLKNDPTQLKIFRESVVPDFDRSEFEVKQVFVPSKDGTKIPIFIAARKGISLDGSHPCEMHGYGGFGINMMPTFSASRIVFLKHLGGVFCLANIRGGGEYGEEWHKAGFRDKKQNVFDDFISAAEYLISSGYTKARRVAIEGGSNGGLLVAACINQRPDLFGCAEANCGVMDMLRFHKFTLGYLWTGDYGCSDKEEEFKWLIKYSPIHNVRRPWEQPGNEETQYPATMILTADHDDRVVPLHSFKLLATMQHVLCTSLEDSPQKNPIIARIQRKAAHYGRATMTQIAEVADRYGFMAKALEAPWID